MKISALLLIVCCGLLRAAPLDLSMTPLFVRDSVSPLTMLVMERDHKLFFEAYNDAADITGDGVLNVGFDPRIDYEGYFDSYKCYGYSSGNQYFYPTSKTSNKICSGQWSGNFLNYVTTAQLDAIRKVLYGGYRVIDTEDLTVIQRTYIPQDGHSWGKEYSNNSSYQINQFTPFSNPGNSRYHLFANTTLRQGNGAPLMRVALNQPYRIWEWVSIERPVAGDRALNGSSGPKISNIQDYVVRVKVCDSQIGLEDNCRIYPSGNYKPAGLLQEFGENDSMLFGLITGSYNNNLAGGVLRKNISSIKDEIDLKTGVFTKLNGIISTLNKFTVVNFQTNYTYKCGWITNRNLSNGECNMWGNPIAEMMYEATRYFAGKKTPTSRFDYSGGIDAELGLPKSNWQDPFSTYPSCSKANMVVISDIYPTYDSNLVPGSYFDSFSGDLTSFNAQSLAQKIFNNEGFSSIFAYIGQSGGDSNGAPTPKLVNSFGNIRGLAPHQSNSQGSYYSSAIAYYAWINNLNPARGKQNVKSYILALSSPLPDFKFKVGGKTIRIIPFGKSVGGYNINPEQGKYQPNNNIVDYYIDSISPTSAVFRINFEDIQQGADFDMDAIVQYTVNVNSDNTLSVKLDSNYAAGSIIQHMGYVISGTTQDGLYLEVRDADTSEKDDPDYFLDTPPGQLPGEGWRDNAPLPKTTSRTFKPGVGDQAQILRSPLWYAAKWGGFNDKNNSGIPDSTDEWDTTNSGDPDNYFLATNPTNLREQLSKAFELIVERTGSFSTAAISSESLSSDSKILQTFFDTAQWTGEILLYALDRNNGDVLRNGSGPAGAMWGAAEVLKTQNFNNGRQIISYLNAKSQGIPFRWNKLDKVQKNFFKINPVSGKKDKFATRRLNYIRGDVSNEVRNGGVFRDRLTPLGDIINSTAKIVGNPAENYLDNWGLRAPENNAPYSTFKARYVNRESMVYVGANDGMLHSFNTNTGREELAYVPSVLYKKLPYLTDQTYGHSYYVDGSPNIIDAFVSGKWRSILAGGLNGGGQAIYVLDVTDPNNFTEANAKSLVVWEFNDSDDRDLGFTYGQPSIIRTNYGKWAVAFGNGLNNTVSDDNSSSTGNAVIYIVSLEDKRQYIKLDTQVGMSEDPLKLGRPNGITSLVVADLNGNRSADIIYAGDLFGNVWKVDISNANPLTWDFSFRAGRTPLPFFKARDANNKPQPITSLGTVTRSESDYTKLQLYVGTGKYLENKDKTDDSIQTIYSLFDDKINPIRDRSQLLQQTILSEDNTQRVVSKNTINNNFSGWYLDLIYNNRKKGERIVSNILYSNGKIIFTTLIPSDDPCNFGGESWLMELDASTGGRLNFHVFDLNNDQKFDSNDSGSYTQGNQTIKVPVSGMKATSGLSFTPSILNAGSKEYKYLSNTGGSIQKINENPGNNAQGRQSWQQLR